MHAHAHAQTASAAVPAQVVDAAPAPTPSITATDPNLDRGFVLPTAMTQPAGSITYNNYELLFHGLTYGLTDRVQASITALSPITSNMPVFLLGSIKGRLVSAGDFHLAVQGSFAYLHSQNDSSDATSSDTLFNFGAGLFASVCLRESCSSMLTATATYGLWGAGGPGGTAQTLIYGGSIAHGVSAHVKLLGEVVSGSVKTASGHFDNAPGALANYGVRFHTERLAGDIGFMKPVLSGGDFGGFLLGLPFISVSYRWM